MLTLSKHRYTFAIVYYLCDIRDFAFEFADERLDLALIMTARPCILPSLHKGLAPYSPGGLPQSNSYQYPLKNMGESYKIHKTCILYHSDRRGDIKR